MEEFSSIMERDGESGQEGPLILVQVQMVNSGLLINKTKSIDGLVAHLLPVIRVMVDGVK